MTPLDERTRREHALAGELEQNMEKTWEAVLTRDYDHADVLWEQAKDKLSELRKLKAAVVIPIRGPKGRGM